MGIIRSKKKSSLDLGFSITKEERKAAFFSIAGTAHVGSKNEYKYKLYPHAELLCNVLHKIADGEEGYERVILSWPPQHGKSETASRWFPAWFLCRNPTKHVILTSYGGQYATEWGEKVRNFIRDFGETIFGVKLDPNSKRKNFWKLFKFGGSMRCAGVRGELTGAGADIIIIDDPVKNDEQAGSPHYQEKTWQNYVATIRSRIRKGTRIIIIMTRWNENDLAGRLIREMENGTGEKFKVINMPAIAEEEEDWSEYGVKHKRKPGDALCPQLHDEKELLATKKASGTYWWSALYQGKPTPDEGLVYKRWWFKSWTPLGMPRSDAVELPYWFDEIITSWDFSFKDKTTSSFTVGQVWARKGINFYLLDQIKAQASFPEAKAMFERMVKAWPEASRHLIEDKANGTAIMAEMKKTFTGITDVEPYGNKLARARATSAIPEGGNLYVPARGLATRVGGDTWCWGSGEAEGSKVGATGFIEEHCAFPGQKFDDQVDTGSQALQHLRANEMSGGLPETESRGTDYSRMIS